MLARRLFAADCSSFDSQVGIDSPEDAREFRLDLKGRLRTFVVGRTPWSAADALVGPWSLDIFFKLQQRGRVISSRC
jgi:hypothetical protein